MPTVHAYECGPVATMCYLVCNEATGTAYVVDAPYGCIDLVTEQAVRSACSITHILLTHSHWDHTADCAQLAASTGAQVLVHEADLYRLIDPMAHTLWPLPFTIEPVGDADLVAGEAGIVVFGDARAPMRWIHTPGHTEGGICFVDDQAKRVFVGDTLFCESVGRTDLPGGNTDLLLSMIKTRLFLLNDDVEVFPGHGPETTIGHERSSNPFVGSLYDE